MRPPKASPSAVGRTDERLGFGYLDGREGLLKLEATITMGVMLFIQGDGFPLGERFEGVGFSLPTSEVLGEVCSVGCPEKEGVPAGPFPVVTVPIVVTGKKGCGVRVVALSVDDL
jgi:hypothetical protein